MIGVDVHLAWCGRCDTMEQNYRTLYMRFDEDMKKIDFLSCEESLIPEEIRNSLKYGPLTCKPRFVIFVEGEKVNEVDGADFTSLETAIRVNMPSDD